MQRLRLKFGRGTPVRFISHLDMMRCWERIFRRASVPLDYTKGFTPHPRMAVAAPLAVGVTSDAELMDVWLRKWIPPQSAMMMVRGELPMGFTVSDVWEVPSGAPALQASLRMAQYRCVAVHPAGLDAARGAADAFLQAASVVHSFARKDEMRSVDLRPLVHSLAVQPGADACCRVDLEVSIGQEGSARPDHVLEVLGFTLPAVSIQRVALGFGWPEEERSSALGQRP
jgi:radical SAM-linked protein